MKDKVNALNGDWQLVSYNATFGLGHEHTLQHLPTHWKKSMRTFCQWQCVQVTKQKSTVVPRFF